MLTKHIGIMVTEGVNDLLCLRSLSQSTPKGTLIREIIITHIEDNNLTIDNLSERYATHMYSHWDLRWRDKMDFKAFMEKSKTDLRVRYKLPDRLIDPIIELCKEQHRIKELLRK